LGFREATPGRHAILLAAVGKKPEELPGSGLLDAIGMQVRTNVLALIFAMGTFAVALGAMLGEGLGTGHRSVGVASSVSSQSRPELVDLIRHDESKET